MRSFIASIIIIFTFMLRAASAQDVVWVQIEAHPSLRTAQQRAQAYAGTLPDVNGFALGGNWYGLVLGPYTRPDAERVLQAYRANRSIPSDSFIALSSGLRQQFWPVGANVLNRAGVAAPQLGNTTDTATGQAALTTPASQSEPSPEPSDETPAQARRSERLLTAAQRKELQVALKAAGFYAAAIDGAYGPGTRRSMADWQVANGYEKTGILTTRQRQALMDQYNAPLISVGMTLVHDPQAGIEIRMPVGEVRFSNYESPFAHYNSSGDLGAQVLLISQPGTQATLYGLYDIMQTLAIVPLEGPRNRTKDRFTLEGRGNGIVSFTQARLIKGDIKGFTLIWPEGDEDRRTRVLADMQASFTRLDAVLDPGAGGETQQHIDLVSGLEIRKPKLSRTGFYIDTKGTVVTTAQAVRGCTRITLNSEYQAELVTSDATLGMAVLRPSDTLAPMSVAQLRMDDPRLQSQVVVSGFSYEGVLGAPSLTFGKLADLKGLRGETELTRLALNALPGDAGGPVFDTGGGVLGMLLPRSASGAASGQQLPKDVSFAADASAIRALLNNAGINPSQRSETRTLAPDDLSRIATGMTVLVSCWE